MKVCWRMFSLAYAVRAARACLPAVSAAAAVAVVVGTQPPHAVQNVAALRVHTHLHIPRCYVLVAVCVVASPPLLAYSPAHRQQDRPSQQRASANGRVHGSRALPTAAH
jgi:hypothetical protein